MESSDAVLARIASAQHGVLTFAQASAAGLTVHAAKQRLSRGEWRRVFRGVYHHIAAPETWKSRLMAACLTGGDGTVASHRSAATLYGLAGGSRELVEITCRRWKRSKHPPLVIHETKSLTPISITTVEGIPTTTVERTLLDLGAVCGPLTVQMALDKALRRRLTTWHKVDETLRLLARSGRPGILKLRAALLSRAGRPTPESEQETALLDLLDRAGFPTAQPQFVIRSIDGSFLARVDAAFPRERIALEYDSDQEHSDPVALARDNARRNKLIAAGWTVISARRHDIMEDGASFLAAIGAARMHALASNRRE